jgi:hypothetical protein
MATNIRANTYIQHKSPLRRIQGTIPFALCSLVDLPYGSLKIWIFGKDPADVSLGIEDHLNGVFLLGTISSRNRSLYIPLLWLRPAIALLVDEGADLGDIWDGTLVDDIISVRAVVQMCRSCDGYVILSRDSTPETLSLWRKCRRTFGRH